MAVARNIDRLSLDRLREVLDYDSINGWLSWRIRLSPMCKFGQTAGRIGAHGYRKIRIDGDYYPASNLAWFHYYGVRPAKILDHKNGCKSDDRIENLREATGSQNAQNIGPRRSTSSGLKGASRNSRGQPGFRSTITVNKNRIYLGSFPTAEDAHAAYSRAAKLMHGEFARTTNPHRQGGDMTTQPIRVQIKSLRDTIPTSDPRHKHCSNIDQLLTTLDTRMPWTGQKFYVPKLLGMNHDTLAYREAKGA